VYISAMVLEIGVPVANITPRPPVSSRMYLVFMNMSKARLLSELGSPAMRSAHLHTVHALRATHIYRQLSARQGQREAVGPSPTSGLTRSPLSFAY
jgi:hypothetical protein